MTILELVLSIWFFVTVFSMAVGIWLGILGIRRASKAQCVKEPEQSCPLLEVLVPIKGVSPNQEEILRSLLTQSYPNYRLSFILENEQDSANEVVSRLCEQYPHARKVLSGTLQSCGQKNHNLIAGVKALRPETQIVMFCDSTNAADSDWLKRFIRPLVTNSAQVVTTFRVFKPQPETVGGVCQALYAALLRLLAWTKPSPWGGATALHRATFDKLRVIDTWSRTVIDDLVLGNVLEAAGVKVTMDPCNLLDSPLRNQSVRGFLAFLDRQILGPKFVNPGLWVESLVIILNLALAILAALILGTLSVAGFVSGTIGWASWSFLLAFLLNVLLLWKVTPSNISWQKWLMCAIPSVILSAFVCLRSIKVNHIDWHGRRYWPGRSGVLLRTELLNSYSGPDSKKSVG